MPAVSCGLTIIGAGPAGSALLVAACNAGLLAKVFARRVTILDREEAAGSGEIGRYRIASDSHADSFLRCIDAGLGRRFPHLLRHPATEALERLRGHAVPLPLVADFVAAVTRALHAVAARAGQPIQTGTQALDATRDAEGLWVTRARRHADGVEFTVTSQYLAIATGAEQPDIRTLAVAGRALWPRHADKLLGASSILCDEGMAAACDRLEGVRAPRVAIIGGSHSAMATAKALLDLPAVDWRPRSIAILHRRPLRPMYPTPAAAHADGFHGFGPDDICRTTGRVFPLAGFRSESRELLLRILGLGGRPREDRVVLLDLTRQDEGTIDEWLDAAVLIVAATGYRPRALPLFDAHLRRIALLAEGPEPRPLVDASSRVLDASGEPVPGVFAIGLSAGYPLAGSHGEPSFRGEANGLALWQAEIGEAIMRRVVEGVAGGIPAPPRRARPLARNAGIGRHVGD